MLGRQFARVGLAVMPRHSARQIFAARGGPCRQAPGVRNALAFDVSARPDVDGLPAYPAGSGEPIPDSHNCGLALLMTALAKSTRLGPKTSSEPEADTAPCVNAGP